MGGLRKSRKAGVTEVRFRRADGEYRWFQISAAPVHDEQGNLVRWYGINIDIDDRKCAEQKLRQNEQELRTITDAIRQSIVVLAPDGTTLYANRVALDHTGFTIDEVNEKDLLRSQAWPRRRTFRASQPGIRCGCWPLHPDDLDRFRAERQEGLSRGVPFELEARPV